MLVPKIVYPSGGGNELLFAFPPVGVRPFDIDARRHDTVMSGGKRQSLLERTDEFLELDITLVPTEVEQYLTRAEEFDHADWVKTQTGAPGVPVVTADQVANPLDGAIDADQIDFPATGAGESSRLEQNVFARVPDATNRTFVHSIYLRADSVLDITMRINDGVDSTALVVTLGVPWQRFSVSRLTDPAATTLKAVLRNDPSQPAKTVYAWGAMLGYDVLRGYIKTEGVIPAAIDRWDTFITAVRDGTNFDYYSDAFAAAFTTYVLEDKIWQPELQVRGHNRFYEFKLKLRKFV
jgi:hypothetical protein